MYDVYTYCTYLCTLIKLSSIHDDNVYNHNLLVHHISYILIKHYKRENNKTRNTIDREHIHKFPPKNSEFTKYAQTLHVLGMSLGISLHVLRMSPSSSLHVLGMSPVSSLHVLGMSPVS